MQLSSASFPTLHEMWGYKLSEKRSRGYQEAGRGGRPRCKCGCLGIPRLARAGFYIDCMWSMKDKTTA